MRKTLERTEYGDFTGETYAEVRKWAFMYLDSLVHKFPDVDLHDIQGVIDEASHNLISTLIVDEFLKFNKKNQADKEMRSDDTSCWELNPNVVLPSDPPKYQWKCKYCGYIIATDLLGPHEPCKCRNKNEKDNEV